MVNQKRFMALLAFMAIAFLPALARPADARHRSNHTHTSSAGAERAAAAGGIDDADIPPPPRPQTEDETSKDVAPTRDPRLNHAVESEANRAGIDPLLVHALIVQESGGNPRARSPKGAKGVMQLMAGTARRFHVNNPYDVGESVRGGVEYLRVLLERYNGNVALALAAYNAGENAVDRFAGIPPYRETKAYVQSIARLYQSLSYHSTRPARSSLRARAFTRRRGSKEFQRVRRLHHR